jgi:7-cyano-7-deazaguanine synthase
VVLLSGGLDSTTCLALAREQQRECYALTVAYGQRHRHEIDCARRVAQALSACEHRIAQVDLDRFGGSALTADIDVPKDRPLDRHEIPITYVPARNTVLLSLALAWAEVLEAGEIWIGVNAVDYSGYPDCRQEFLRAFEALARLATKKGVVDGLAPRIVAPLLDLTKVEIVRLGRELRVDWSLTSSCYDPDPQGRPCRHCDACRLRAQGFAGAGLVDPL